jgi:hypothetical protein
MIMAGYFSLMKNNNTVNGFYHRLNGFAVKWRNKTNHDNKEY